VHLSAAAGLAQTKFIGSDQSLGTAVEIPHPRVFCGKECGNG
jgi:hypothetical protein